MNTYLEYLDMVKHIAVMTSGVLLCLFSFYTGYFGALPGMQLPVVHYGLVAFLGFLVFDTWKKKTVLTEIINWLFSIMILISMIYLFIYDEEISMRMVQIEDVSTGALVLGTITLILTLELARRTLGPVLPMISVIGIIYMFLAPNLSGVLYYKGMPFYRFIEQLFLTTNGIMGDPLVICATYVFMFVIFGAFLDASGAGEFFMDISKTLVGRYHGGPGLMAVVSSALMGTISGSSVANVATTGAFTIPLMKKTGYKNEFAGAVEAVSSTGGQILPPVMGAGAFIMSEFIGMPYHTIIKCAAIPALLYFFSVFVQVYLEARKLNLKGADISEIKPAKQVFRETGYCAIPLITIIYLLVSGYSELRSGLIGVAVTILISMIKPQTRMSIHKIAETMQSASERIVSIAAACACAGIVICIIRVTGLGLKFSSAVIELSGGNLAFALVLTMCSSLVLGMGLPVTASYIIQASLTAPALVNMGLMPIQAHLFVFYFSCMADITPPVALAAFTAAPLCGGNATKVGFTAWRLGLAAFIVPYAFVYGPALLLIGDDITSVFIALVTAVMGCSVMAVALIGWLKVKVNPIIRIALMVGALGLIVPGVKTDLIGVAIIVVMLGIHFKMNHCSIMPKH